MRGNARTGCSAFVLKLSAMAAMLIDHLAWAFLPQHGWLGILAHTVGAMAMPIFAFFIAEGYNHTRSVPAYARRLAIFALLSYVPYVYFTAGVFDGGMLSGGAWARLNVLYTLLLALAALWAWDHIAQGELRMAAILALCLAAIPGDGIFFPVLLALAFHHAGKDRRTGFAMAAALCLGMFFITLWGYVESPGDRSLAAFAGEAGYRLGALASLALLARYDGRRGPAIKWLFYGFYPLHMALLCLALYLR